MFVGLSCDLLASSFHFSFFFARASERAKHMDGWMASWNLIVVFCHVMVKRNLAIHRGHILEAWIKDGSLRHTHNPLCAAKF